MNNAVITIAKDFSETPGGRYRKEGQYSGEEFRIVLLEPKFLECLKNNTILTVDLDGCLGYPSSFLDESFGGLARTYGSEKCCKGIVFISYDQPDLPKFIYKIMQNE